MTKTMTFFVEVPKADGWFRARVGTKDEALALAEQVEGCCETVRVRKVTVRGSFIIKRKPGCGLGLSH
jgi:hypothetical protein